MMPTKIAIIGCGAVGLNYGLRLIEAESGQNPPLFQTFLVLRHDYHIVSQHGIILQCNNEEAFILSPSQASAKIFSDVSALELAHGTMDLIVIAVKGYSFSESFIESFKKIADSRTKILVIVNGLGIEEKLTPHFDRSNIFGGVSLIGCNRQYSSPPSSGPVVICNFKDHRLDIGHIDDDQSNLEFLLRIWQSTKIGSLVNAVPSLLAARWSKLCWNITFSGIAVSMNGITVDFIERDPSLRHLANEVMKEVMSIARADILYQHSCKIRNDGTNDMSKPYSAEYIDALEYTFVNPLPETEAHISRMWASTINLGAYKSSTVVDLIEGRELEIENIFSYPLLRAKFLSTVFSDLSFSHLESVVLMVEGMGRIRALIA